MSEVIAFVELMGSVHSLDEALDDLSQFEFVRAVYSVTGPYDYLVEIRCRSMWEFSSALDTLTSRPWVTGARSSKVKSVEKEPNLKFVKIDRQKEKSLLEKGLIAFMGINVRSNLIKPLIHKLKSIPNIKRIYVTTGDHDILIELWINNMYEYSKVVESIHTYEFLKSTQTAFVLRIKKQAVAGGE